MLKALNPILDLDIIVYKCGFAVKDHEPTSHALQNVKTTISRILDNFPERTWEKMFLSGNTNFREHIATIKEYKANRTKPRPRDYVAIREYMVKEWGAVVTDGQEADDAIGIEQFKHKDKSTVIVTIDKDLMMIPGWHFDWTKNKMTYVDRHNADINLFRQMIEGDTSDHIPGIDGLGKVKTQKIIDECGGDIERLRNKVKELYAKQYGATWQEAYEEVGGLLWIRREEGQVCPLL
jgi:5'-3' exonuclease